MEEAYQLVTQTHSKQHCVGEIWATWYWREEAKRARDFPENQNRLETGSLAGYLGGGGENGNRGWGEKDTGPKTGLLHNWETLTRVFPCAGEGGDKGDNPIWRN